jgi:hypothetical protein
VIISMKAFMPRMTAGRNCGLDTGVVHAAWRHPHVKGPDFCLAKIYANIAKIYLTFSTIMAKPKYMNKLS